MRRLISQAAIVVGLLVTVFAGAASALNPQSPEVRELIEKGLDRLSRPAEDERLGARCLTAIAMLKAGRGDSPRVQEALAACELGTEEILKEDVYSHGLAVIFLCEANAQDKKDLVRRYLAALKQRQKPHGGWGYDYQSTGDTSQTQYMALAMWEAHNRGYPVDADSAKGLLDWLVATQGPDGEWGYQGIVRTTSQPVSQTRVTCTMGAAALGSLMIGSDLFGKLQVTTLSEDSNSLALPRGVRRAAEDRGGRRRTLPSRGVNWREVSLASGAGETWMRENFVLPAKRYGCYYLYALERYQSFREFRDGAADPSPDWYERGFEYLRANQKAPGEWDRECGVEPDTAFAVLFLLRSTQKSLKRSLGEGALVSGRGLPRKLAGARLSRGRVVAEVDEVEITDFLSLVSEGEAARLDALADGPAGLLGGVDNLSEDDARRLQQLLRGGEPDARIVAARALGASGKLDHAPDMLYALTDPDPRVVIAARDGLRRISRRPRGFDLRDSFDDDDRWAALERWKRWYLGVRPGAVLELE